MKEFVLKMLSIYRPFWKDIVIVLCIVMLGQLSYMIGPYFIGEIINGLNNKAGFNEIFLLALALFFSRLLSIAINIIQDRYEINNIDFDVRDHIRSKTLKKIMGLSSGQHHNNNSGLKKNVINKGENAIRSFASMMFYGVIPLLLTSISTIFVLIIFNVALGVIVLIGFILSILMVWLSFSTFKDKLKKVNDLGDSVSTFHTEIIRKAPIIQTSSEEDRVIRIHDRKLAARRECGKKLWNTFIIFAYSPIYLNPIILCSLVIVGAWQVSNETYEAGLLVTFILWSTNALGRLGQMNYFFRELSEMIPQINKYFRLLDIKPAIQIIKNSKIIDDLQGCIEFNDVRFSYPTEYYFDDLDDNQNEEKPKEKVILNNINFTINPGEKVAIVGESGAGKTTITYLLSRWYDPDKGSVLIDGYDLKDLDLKWFRKNIGIVEQSIELFDHTLRYNIIFGLNGRSKSATKERLNYIAEISRINLFFDRLTLGFNTKIGENGVKLSGGERQRVGIARALIRDPKILILDEATSSLDAVNEKHIKEAIDEISKGRTTIIIAHRLSTVKNADRILVLNKGRVIAEGKHEHLMSSCGKYRELIEAQLSF